MLADTDTASSLGRRTLPQLPDRSQSLSGGDASDKPNPVLPASAACIPPDPTAVAEWARGLPPGPAQRDILRNLADHLVSSDITAAQELALSLPPGNARNDLLAATADRLARMDVDLDVCATGGERVPGDGGALGGFHPGRFRSLERVGNRGADLTGAGSGGGPPLDHRLESPGGVPGFPALARRGRTLNLRGRERVV